MPDRKMQDQKVYSTVAEYDNNINDTEQFFSESYHIASTQALLILWAGLGQNNLDTYALQWVGLGPASGGQVVHTRVQDYCGVNVYRVKR